MDVFTGIGTLGRPQIRHPGVTLHSPPRVWGHRGFSWPHIHPSTVYVTQMTPVRWLGLGGPRMSPKNEREIYGGK